jgi:hypothetical protein
MRRLLLALCAVTLISGCGGGVDPTVLATAVHKTQASGGAEVATRIEMELPGQGAPVEMTGNGVVDTEGLRGHMTMTVPGIGEMETVADGFTMYMRSYLLGPALGGKEWMKVDLKRTSESMGVDLSSLEQMGQGSTDQLKLLEKVSGDVSEAGRDTVTGVEATHYKVTLDLRKYPGQNPEKLIELIGQSEIPMDVWVDDQQRVRRMEWEQTIRKNGMEMKLSITSEYVRFGVPVEIDIPDESEVFDATDLAAGALEQLN